MDTLRLDYHGSALHVVLSRPEVHDAFDERVVAELAQAFALAAEDEDARVVVLRSTGKSFCAGADLSWMQRIAAQSQAENLADAGRLDDAFRAIATCPKPVVARVQGAALGGGAGLVAACDLAVASERATFAFSEVRLGILPAVISPYVLRKLGPGRAKALFLTGERFDAARAREIGLVDRVAPEAELDAALDAVVAELLQASPQAQAAVKPLVAAVAAARTLDEARDITTRAIASARASEDGREGMAAFLEKRKPRWTEGG